jgi:hypothetical protein
MNLGRAALRCASRQKIASDVLFGSEAGIQPCLSDVRFLPESGHLDSSGCGGSQRNMQREIDADWSR